MELNFRDCFAKPFPVRTLFLFLLFSVLSLTIMITLFILFNDFRMKSLLPYEHKINGDHCDCATYLLFNVQWRNVAIHLMWWMWMNGFIFMTNETKRLIHDQCDTDATSIILNFKSTFRLTQLSQIQGLFEWFEKID